MLVRKTLIMDGKNENTSIGMSDAAGVPLSCAAEQLVEQLVEELVVRPPTRLSHPLSLTHSSTVERNSVYYAHWNWTGTRGDAGGTGTLRREF